MTATIAALYAALDEPDANVPMVLGALANAYFDIGDEVRGRVIRWCWRRGKEPAFNSLAGIAHEWHSWQLERTGYRHEWHSWQLERTGYRDILPERVWFLGNVCVWHKTRSAAYRALADACAEWVERRRGTS